MGSERKLWGKARRDPKEFCQVEGCAAGGIILRPEMGLAAQDSKGTRVPMKEEKPGLSPSINTFMKRLDANQQFKDCFAGNPTPDQLAETASAIKSWVAASKDYALGPDDIIVKLQSGQTKNTTGLLEGSWSSTPGHVSYTQWARDWHAAENANPA